MSYTKPWIAFVLITCFVQFGCATIKESDTARTGLEQLLISNAVDQSLAKVDFRAVSGAKVFLKTDYLECVDKNYIVLSTRSKLLANNCTLVDKADDADVVLEIASGGVGTDRTGLVVGSPEIPLGLMGSIPKINLYERNKAMGTAKLTIVATDTKTKQPVINSGYALARSDHQHWTMLGAGPVMSGSVADQIKSHTGQSETLVTVPPITKLPAELPPRAASANAILSRFELLRPFLVRQIERRIAMMSYFCSERFRMRK